MGKYFGTDGIRGEAGRELSCELATKTGFALARLLARGGDAHPLVLVGRDTRLSGSMLESALAAGMMEGGAAVASLGVLPTPAVALIAAKMAEAAGGVVISASHNPFCDNGIKIFGPQGFKLTDEQEDEIERWIDNPPDERQTGAGVGFVRAPEGDFAGKYCAHVERSTGGNLGGLKLLIDCSNGAASLTAQRIFPALGADCEFIFNEPDGMNINEGCGSTHMSELVRRMQGGGFDLGIAFDGDADRCLLADERGVVIDGDRIMGVLARDMRQRGVLRGPVVGTIVTNLGLKEYLKGMGVELLTADVGDRYVLELMRASNCNLGGEQSGHTVLLDCGTTGDGQLTAASFARALAQSGKRASEIAGEIELYPQVTINVAVPHKIKKEASCGPAVRRAVETAARVFGEHGRILVRPSGTEAKVRVMVEGRDINAVEQLARQTADAIKSEAGM